MQCIFHDLKQEQKKENESTSELVRAQILYTTGDERMITGKHFHEIQKLTRTKIKVIFQKY
jgi:hypothetical protein